MSSVFKLIPLKQPQLQEYKERAMDELNDFFEMSWKRNTPKIFVIDTREEIDLFREEKSKDWVVGWSMGSSAICILNPKNIGRESSHRKDYDIEKLVKHELVHTFFNSKFGRSKFPWISEGIAIYLAGQLDKYKMPEEFTGFLEGKDSKRIYKESGNAIKLLIDKFGKRRLFEFFGRQSGVKDGSRLAEVFVDVYKLDLNYRLFNELREKSKNDRKN